MRRSRTRSRATCASSTRTATRTINDQDRVFFDNPVPKLTTGLFLDSRWRSLDFGVNLRGAFGHRIYNAVKLGTERTVGLDNIRRGVQSRGRRRTRARRRRARCSATR
jgi:hypothetical protein